MCEQFGTRIINSYYVSNFSNVNHTVDVIVAFNEGQTSLLCLKQNTQ